MRFVAVWMLHFLLLSLVLSFIPGTTPVSRAQSNFVTLSGTVTDQLGAMATNMKVWVNKTAG